jgi:dTMP kinase
MGLAFHQRIHAGFRAIAAAEPERCVLLDASGSEAGVAGAIWGSVRSRLLP